MITGRLTRAENNTYISQLTVLVNAQLVGIRISCFHDSEGTLISVGSSLLNVTQGMTL